MIQMSKERVTSKALLDSRATESFLHPWIVEELKLFTYELEQPRKVCNINGTDN
jgi:hypothetical protein